MDSSPVCARRGELVRTCGHRRHRLSRGIDEAGGRRQEGLDPGIRRFGVGAEYDLYAPHCDQSEVLLIAGSDFAPSGYAWVFPWGRHRVRVGVGIIHPIRAAIRANISTA